MTPVDTEPLRVVIIGGGLLACVIDTDHAVADTVADRYSTTAYCDLDSALDGPAEFDIVAVWCPAGCTPRSRCVPWGQVRM
ncbi:MAG: hypothetical protein ACRDOK_07980 [Streptosporangiaceae bacterium]